VENFPRIHRGPLHQKFKSTVVSKDELISRVWPGRIIEEGNLRAQIRALRMALADRDLIGRPRGAAINSRAGFFTSPRSAPAPGVSTHGGRAAASQQRDRASTMK
jgi:hypothetical protein